MAKSTKKKAKKKTARKPAAKTRTAKGSTRKASARKPAPKAAMRARADLGASADGYFQKLAPGLKEAAMQLRSIVRAAAPEAKESIKWGMPVYEHHGMLCYIRAWPAYVTLGFYDQGIDLTDPTGSLAGTGDNMRHVKVRSAADIQPDLFAGWIKQAAAINAGDASGGCCCGC
jgi:hypothetical protein